MDVQNKEKIDKESVENPIYAGRGNKVSVGCVYLKYTPVIHDSYDIHYVEFYILL